METGTGTPGPTPRPRPEAASEEVEDRDPKSDTEPERLVRSLTTGDQHQVSHLFVLLIMITDDQALDQLYAYMKEHPEKEGEVNTVIGTLATAVQAYVRRMLDSRKNADNPCASLLYSM
jgi:hypothetical protein